MNMKIMLILCTPLLLTYSQNTFTQDEEEIAGSPSKPGKDTRTGHIWFSPDKETTKSKSPTTETSPATQPVTGTNKSEVIRGSGVEGKQGYKSMTSPTAMQPGVGSRTRLPTTRSGSTASSPVPPNEPAPPPPPKLTR